MIQHSFVNDNPQIDDRVWQELRRSGLNYDQAIATGHRYVDADEAKQLTGHRLPGLLFEYRNLIGKPYTWKANTKWKERPFCRLKPDWDNVDAETIEKYKGDGDLPKYLSPPKSGSRPYFSPLQPHWQTIAKRTNIDLDFTEGEKKADCLNAHGFPTIGLSGVNCNRDSRLRDEEIFTTDGSAWDVYAPPEPVSRFLPELNEDINYRYRSVGIVFDSDIVVKRLVQRALDTLANDLKTLRADPFPIILPNELDGSKNGVDDFIFRHGVEAYRELRSAWKSIQRSPYRLLTIDKDSKSGDLKFNYTEPIPKIKGIMAWAVLKDRVAYRPDVGWYEWTGTRWKFLQPEAFDALLQQFCNAQGWLNISINHINAIAKYLRNEVLVPDEQWNGSTKRAFANGTFDFGTKEFIPGWNREDYLTIALPYDWIPFEANQCSRWLQFLREATGDDEQLIDFLQAVLRWILTPKQIDRKFPIEQLYDFFGNRGTGKGTFLEVLELLAGSENVATLDQDVLATPESRASLIGKLVAIDRDSQGHWSKATILNKVASNEPVSTRSLYKNYSPNTRLGVVLVRAYNDFQSVPSGSQGLDRRLVPIRFDRIPANPDIELIDKLRDELAAIGAWVWSISDAEMYRRLRWGARGIANIRETAVERFEANNPIFSFLRDEFPNGVEAIAASELYERYSDHCKRNGRRGELSNTTFGRTLKSWEVFGVIRDITSSCRTYTIPKPEALLEAGLVPFAAPPPSPPPDRHGGLDGGFVEGSMEGSNPVQETSVQGMEGLDPQTSFISPTQPTTDPDPPSQPYKPYTTGAQSGSKPSMEPSMEKEKPSNPPWKKNGANKKQSYRPLLKPGDRCRYKGPEGALKVTCGWKILTVTDVDYEAGTATIRAEKWAPGVKYAVPLEHLRRERE